jgi:vacuolar-type H+-ATPase subunit D/Vma8
MAVSGFGFSKAKRTRGLTVDERTELMELRKRLKRVEMECDILKLDADTLSLSVCAMYASAQSVVKRA